MLYVNSYSIKNKLNIKGKEMLYIPKIGDIVKVNRMIGNNPKLLQNNQEVENITDEIINKLKSNKKHGSW